MRKPWITSCFRLFLSAEIQISDIFYCQQQEVMVGVWGVMVGVWGGLMKPSPPDLSKRRSCLTSLWSGSPTKVLLPPGGSLSGSRRHTGAEGPMEGGSGLNNTLSWWQGGRDAHVPSRPQIKAVTGSLQSMSSNTWRCCAEVRSPSELVSPFSGIVYLFYDTHILS